MADSSRRARTRVLAVSALVLGLVGGVLPTSVASAAPAASYTTTNVAVDGTGHCGNGGSSETDPVNCNIYDAEKNVWMNGGPATAELGDGRYFFAVLDPGGQNNGIEDGATDNLSSAAGTSRADRRFSVANGDVTYSGSHDQYESKLRLWPYADTSNPGGVYILAVCHDVAGTQPSDCRYDAFKVVTDAGGTAWYGQVKTVQELAKDTFDAINDAGVFSPS